MMAPSGVSELAALGAQLGDDLVDALLLDRTHTARREAQRHPTLLGLQPETLCMQVRQEAAALLVVGVRDSVTDTRLLAGDLADAGHTNNLEISVTYGRGGASCPIPGRALYQPGGAITRRRQVRPPHRCRSRSGMASTRGVAWANACSREVAL